MMRGGCAAGVAVCLSLSPACSGDGGGAFEGEPGKQMPADFEDWVPSMEVVLDGGEPAFFLLDTGAPVTLADTDDFPELAEGWHDLDLVLDQLRFSSVEVGALDVFGFTQNRAVRLSGIIGGNLLADFALSFDYRDARVWMEDGPPAELPEAVAGGNVDDPVEIDARVEGGGFFRVAGETREIGATRFLVRAAVEDQSDENGFWALVDSGASSVVLSNELLEELGDQGRPRLDGIPVGTQGGAQTAYLTRVWSMRVGDAANGAVEQTSVPVLSLPDDGVFEAISDEVGLELKGIVGGMFLRRYLATLDYPGEAMRLLPYVSSEHIDPLEFVGLGFELVAAGDEWLVAVVYPGTDADAEGLLVGDTVAELAGEPTAGRSFDALDATIRSRDVGDEIAVGIARGDEIEQLLVSVEDLLPAFEVPQ
jgi:Aspartyl protease